MEDLKQDVQYLSKEVTQYLDTEVKLAKLELMDVASEYSASIFSRVIITLMATVSYSLFMIALGVYLTPLFAQPWLGTLLAAGASVVILLIVYLLKKYILEGPVQDYVISKLSKTFLS